MQSGLFSELVLIDANREKAEGEALDIAHGIPFARQMKIYAGDYDDIMDSAVIIVTAGANQKPEETRLDLVHKNVNIFKSIIPEVAKRDYQGILLIVANPVDILTYTGAEAERHAGEQGDRLRDCAGYRQAEIPPWRAPLRGQPECACLYCRRAWGQRDRRISSANVSEFR